MLSLTLVFAALCLSVEAAKAAVAHAATARGVVESPGRWILSHTRFTVLLTTVCYNQWRKQLWLTAQRHADRRQLRQLGMHPCVLSQAVANPHSNSVAPNRAALAQHQQCGLWLPRKHQFFAIFCEIDLATVWRIFSRAHLQEVLRACQFFQPEKRQSFVPGSVFTRDHTLLNCYTSQLLDDAGG